MHTLYIYIYILADIIDHLGKYLPFFWGTHPFPSRVACENHVFCLSFSRNVSPDRRGPLRGALRKRRHGAGSHGEARTSDGLPGGPLLDRGASFACWNPLTLRKRSVQLLVRRHTRRPSEKTQDQTTQLVSPKPLLSLFLGSSNGT